MRTLWLVLGVVLLWAGSLEAACTGSSPNWTSTSDNASMASCINSATSGDTITVTGSGSAAWSWNSTKALHIIGPGAATLTITSQFRFSPTVAESTKVFELSGLTLSGTNTFLPVAQGSSNPITKLLLHHLTFTNASSTRCIYWPGLEWGVLYSSTFNASCFLGISIIGANDAGWAAAYSFGSDRYLFIEDCIFLAHDGNQFISESGQGGREVFRYNEIFMTGGGEILDIHGNQDSGIRATVSSEYYNNLIHTSGQYRWMFIRGGQNLIMNNTVTPGAPSFQITEFHAWGHVTQCHDYPAPDQIFNSYFFHNTVGGSNQNPSTFDGSDDGICPGSGGDDAFLVNGRDYWTPTYGLAANRPGTCTANNTSAAYYGSTDTNVIYKCTATNTWTVFFQPYPYPHPLRQGGSGSDVTAPSAPTNLRVT